MDWKKKDRTEKKELSPTITAQFFRKIFQAEKTKNDTKLAEAKEDVERYDKTCDVTDANFTEKEIQLAAKKMKSGVGIDGISSKIMSVSPKALLDITRKLFNSIFGYFYPECWNEQILLAFAKKDHSRNKPSLRGVGIGPVLSRCSMWWWECNSAPVTTQTENKLGSGKNYKSSPS